MFCRSCCAFCCHIVSDIRININGRYNFSSSVYIHLWLVGLAWTLIWIDLLFSFIVNACNYCMNAVQRWNIYNGNMSAWRKRNHLYFGNCLLYWFSLCLFCYCMDIGHWIGIVIGLHILREFNAIFQSKCESISVTFKIMDECKYIKTLQNNCIEIILFLCIRKSNSSSKQDCVRITHFVKKIKCSKYLLLLFARIRKKIQFEKKNYVKKKFEKKKLSSTKSLVRELKILF